MKISEVLFIAANTHLSAYDPYNAYNADDDDSCETENNDDVTSPFTCDCIGYAIAAHSEPYDDATNDATMAFLVELGFPSDSCNRFDLFDDFDRGQDRQEVRYAWLMLTYQIALEEGI